MQSGLLDRPNDVTSDEFTEFNYGHFQECAIAPALPFWGRRRTHSNRASYPCKIRSGGEAGRPEHTACQDVWKIRRPGSFPLGSQKGRMGEGKGAPECVGVRDLYLPERPPGPGVDVGL